MDQGIINLHLENKKELKFVELTQTDIQYVWFVLCHLSEFLPTLLLQSVANHIVPVSASSKPASVQQVNQLEEQLEHERRLVETLETKQRTLQSQLERASQRETELQEEVTTLEKNLTILRHDLKEVRLWIPS
jgi:septal ring factor EnvC (AmiA/AmiB activator)